MWSVAIPLKRAAVYNSMECLITAYLFYIIFIIHKQTPNDYNVQFKNNGNIAHFDLFTI